MKLKTQASTTADGRRPAAGETRGNPAAPRLRPSAFGLRAAFSLVEIIVVVGLLSMIILGLLAMFNQTQRAFRGSMTQVDVLEGGRAASGLLARELEQIAPSDSSQATNFYAAIPPDPLAPFPPPPYWPLAQPLPGLQPNPFVWRTNLIEDLFFLVRQNQTWTGIGYHLDTPYLGFGTLYRFQTNSFFGQDPAQLFPSFLASSVSNMSRVLDGVVHFKVRAFDLNGVWQTTNNTGLTIIATNSAWGEVGLYACRSNAVPATVELEIGLLEQRALQQVKAIPSAGAQWASLTNLAGRVHVFRQRVSIPGVDPTAYTTY